MLVVLGLGLLVGWSANVPSVRAQLKASPLFLTLNSPATRSVDSFLYGLRHRAPTVEDVGDGGPAAGILLEHPVGLAEDRDGNIYISDRGLASGGRFIWRVSPDGTAMVIAGSGRKGVPRTGSLARVAALGTPQGVAVDREGRVNIADSYNHLVLRVERDGRLTRVAGTGYPGDRGDGGPAERATLNQPYDVRFDADGGLLIADYGNHRIRRVDRDGVIRTVAGTGEPGYEGDGGLATAARLRGPYGVFPGPDGSVWIADSENHVVRRVDPGGIIRTVAGTGRRGYAGDGGPAREAAFDSPQGLYVTESGVYVNDEHNHVIRFIEPGGDIRTVLGTGSRGRGDDESAAGHAELDDPENILVCADGSLLISERRRVRMVSPQGEVGTFAGRLRPEGR